MRLLRVQTLRRGSHRIDAREQFRVHVDRRAVGGEPGSHVALHRLQGLVGIRGGEVPENARDATQRAAGLLQRDDRVFEIRRRRLPGDGGDLRLMVRERTGEGGREMLRADAREGRQAERRRPVFEKGIVAHAGPR